MTPRLKPQEIPLDHPDSFNMFQPNAEKPLLATPAAIDLYQMETIFHCLCLLQQEAASHDGLDYLQVFHDDSKSSDLWFIEDGDGGAITALLRTDY